MTDTSVIPRREDTEGPVSSQGVARMYGSFAALRRRKMTARAADGRTTLAHAEGIRRPLWSSG